MAEASPLLSVRGLSKSFPRRVSPWGGRERGADPVRAVEDVSFHVDAGETLGLVGESGSGKTTTGRAVLRLVEPDAGEVLFDGEDVGAMDGRALRRLRRRAQIVFQDPTGSLNPRMTSGAALDEVLKVHGLAGGRAGRRRRALELLERVGLGAEHLDRHPHTLSGGQRQRLGIARSLAVEPEFLVLDEPASSLDVPVQAQVVDLLARLQEELGLAYLLIAHDLALVEQVSHRVAVMYAGRIVETAPSEVLYRSPRHPYTRELLAAVPVPEPGRRRASARPPAVGTEPPPGRPRSGCPFHPRCLHPGRGAGCLDGVPLLEEKGDGHWVACIAEPVEKPANRDRRGG